MSCEPSSSDASATPPNPKRRRPNGYTSSAILSKPFKTPLRKPIDNATPTSTPASQSKYGNSPRVQQSPKVTRKNPVNPVQRPFKPFTTSTSQGASDGDPETRAAIQEAQRKQAHLATELNGLKQEIDTLEQAIALTGGEKGKDLEVLVGKWKLAARQAADEVFVSASRRVKEMGGVAAWKRKEREATKQREWEDQSWAVEQHEHENEDLEDDPEDSEETRARKQAKREGLWPSKRDDFDVDCNVEGLVGLEPDGIDDLSADEVCLTNSVVALLTCQQIFTMDMMLVQLGIDLNMLGYDKEKQAWVD